MGEQNSFEVSMEFKGKTFLFDEPNLQNLKEKFYYNGTLGLVFGEDTLLRDTRTGSEVRCSAGELWDVLMKAEGKLRKLREQFYEEQLRERTERVKETERKQKHRQEVERVARERLFDAGLRRVEVIYHDETYIQLKGEKRHWFRKCSCIKTFKIEKNADRGTWFLLPVNGGVL
ncbi:hypothetical protein 278BB001_119 [Bacillus phage 278BB001]|nr:hypothetical protein 278BB001_119 [Bacillus phage 278BB001]